MDNGDNNHQGGLHMSFCIVAVNISNPLLLEYLAPLLPSLKHISLEDGSFMSANIIEETTLTIWSRMRDSPRKWLDDAPDCLGNVYPALLRLLQKYVSIADLPTIIFLMNQNHTALNHAYHHVNWTVKVHATGNDLDRHDISQQLGLSISEAYDTMRSVQRRSFTYDRDTGSQYQRSYSAHYANAATDA